MNCEICDKRMQNPVRIKLEGAVVNVCESCAKLGEKIEMPKSVASMSDKAVIFAPKHRELELSREDIVENYAILVKNARERHGLTQEALASKILEKEFIIHRIEQNRMQPTIEIAKKLQRALGIQLITMVAENSVETGGSLDASGATLADFIKVKKKK